MFIREIEVPLTNVRGVGPQTVRLLSNLGIANVGELLSYWPRDWDDRTVEVPLSAHAKAANVNANVQVLGHEWFGFGRMKTLKIRVMDGEGTEALLVCFNRPFLEKQFPPESRAVIHGKFAIKYGELQSTAFEIEREEEASRTVLPVYPLTAGLTQATLRKIIRRALGEYGKGIDSELPEKIRNLRGLPDKQSILHLMHEPTSVKDALEAKRALIFEELFLFEYALGKRALARRGYLPVTDGQAAPEPPRTLTPAPTQRRLIERLPFQLTADQKTVLAEINEDLGRKEPMARLLQGDVGSGKTLVAFLAALAVIENGGQVALLTPTELLSRQHAENAAKLLEPLGIRLAFLTGNLKASGRSRLLAQLKAGEIDLVIGTHALFSRGVEYRNLRLVVIDEQHRFGVLQRSAILEKGMSESKERLSPHLLMMSATPIPRTLALSVFGDMDISQIKTLPPGRKTIATHLARQGNENRVYDFVRKELAAGRQAYFVYPLIEESEDLSLKSAAEMKERLSAEIFPEYQCALVHSKIPEDEQRSIMAEFRLGTIRILVTTSVVEVGVDVPNATCIVIEHAERFGLAALHQLRGRVGRGEAQSYCFLVYSDKLTENGKERMKVLHSTTDGFVIAEEDLRLRGPGDIAGIEQSGYLSFSLADPVRDIVILQEARSAAFNLLLEESGNS